MNSHKIKNEQRCLWTLIGVLALSACGTSKPGKNGVNGTNGDGGAPGKPSLVNIVDEPSGTHCAAGGKRIDTGLDINGNGALDTNEVTASTYVCAGLSGANGADGSPGADGVDGGPGAPGRSSLIRTAHEPAGANCAYGGVRIETGLDTNGDGALQDGEVNAAETQFLCDASGLGSCTANGALTISGDYTASDGTEHWLRRTATATSYTVVPSGAPTAAKPPQLFRVELVCAQWLLLETPDGTFGRLDWSTVGGALSICVRSAPNATAVAALSTPDSTNTATGCPSGSWTVLTKETP